MYPTSRHAREHKGELSMLEEFLVIFFGGLLIVLLANIVIKKTVALAEHWGWSGTFIGMTVLSIGTSLPEILTALAGSYQVIREPKIWETVSAIVVGGNIGSDILQQNFILGIVALLGTVILVKKKVWPLIGGLVGSSLMLFFIGLRGVFSRWEGGLMLIIYFAYLFYLKKKDLDDEIEAKSNLSKGQLVMTILILLTSFGVMAFLVNEILKATRSLVELLPLSASFLGIIILGTVSALPELSTALLALKEKKKGMSVGVLIGSNITNPMFALGLGALISTYAMPEVVVWYDLPFKILTALLIGVFLWKSKKLRKIEAITLMVLFLIYLALRGVLFPIDIFY